MSYNLTLTSEGWDFPIIGHVDKIPIYQTSWYVNKYELDVLLSNRLTYKIIFIHLKEK